MSITRRPLLLAGLFAPAIARAQPAWRPDRPVRLVVPFAPGGATDVVARVLSESVGQQLGQSIVIENRAGGAAGVIGTESVAKAAPDGHTLLLNSNAHVVTPSLVARMPYSIVAHPSTPYQSLADVVAGEHGRIDLADERIAAHDAAVKVDPVDADQAIGFAIDRLKLLEQLVEDGARLGQLGFHDAA